MSALLSVPAKRKVLLLGGLAVLGLACSKDPTQSCTALPDDQLLLYEGSRLSQQDTLIPGKRVRCDASRELGPLFADTLARVPRRLRPKVTVHENPKTPADLAAIRYHAPTHSLLVSAEAASDLTQSVVLHEIAHVALDGPRPTQRVARRLHRALNEAVADYWAAQLSRDPRLGSQALGEIRDLEKPPTLGDSEWARLALPQAFPAHRFAHALSAILWQQASRDLDYLADLVATLAAADPFDPKLDTPSEVVEALTARCPARSRHRLQQALRTWLPSELVESS